MSLVEKRRSVIKSLYMSVVCDRLKVEHILSFADELRDEDVPLNAFVTASHSREGHCTGLSVRISEESLS